MAQGRGRRSETGTIIVGVHNRQRLQEQFGYEDTIDLVLEKFARQLKVDAGSISLLHQGSRLDRRATVQVARYTGGAGGGVVRGVLVVQGCYLKLPRARRLSVCRTSS